MYYLYRHIRLDKNEPFYIGIGKTKNYERAYKKTSRNKFWRNIVSKTEYDVEILYECETLEEANKKEIEFIKLHGRRNLGLGPLVNLTDGGEGTKNIKLTEDQRTAISERNKGYKHTEEAKLKIKKAASNISEITRIKMSLARKNKKRILSEEAKEKIKLGAIKSHYNRKPAKDCISVIDIINNKIWHSINSCAKELNISYVSLRRYLTGKRKNKYPNLKIIEKARPGVLY